jgi:hypothetical protein
MQRFERNLAAEFLREASNVYSNFGCNDTPQSLFDDLAESEKGELERNYNKWNCPSGDLNEYVEFKRIPDYAWMSYLAYVLEEE